MAPSQLTLEKLTVEDIPAMTEIWYAAFTQSHVREAIPDTPGVRKWFADCTANDLTERPYQTYLKILDLESKDNEGKPRMVAWGKWDQSMPNERGPRFFLPWSEDMMPDRCDLAFDGFEANRKKVMGEERHIFLDTLCTHPDYWRRGAGSMIVKWGCDLADQEGISAYLDASKNGAPLYEKFGFVDEGNPDDSSAPMARRKR
ncbi:acyl-CoA N-acyltransferase [Penicillium sp. IBT 16267x]|nr:acyl-CoA N-acyltransferase [Penicillium sp. IBT 16267x]